MKASNLLSRARQTAPEAALGRVVLTISAAALATAGLAACSGKSTPSTGPSPTVSASSAAPATSSPAVSSPATSAGALSGPNVCSILTSARVASIMADPVAHVTRSQDGANSACTYALVHSTIEVQLAPFGSNSTAGYAGFSGLVTTGANPAGSSVAVPGLGQQALLSSFGVAVRTAQSAFLVRNVSGQVANQLDIDLSRAVISALS